jgi:hypothetical protein
VPRLLASVAEQEFEDFKHLGIDDIPTNGGYPPPGHGRWCHAAPKSGAP